MAPPLLEPPLLPELDPGLVEELPPLLEPPLRLPALPLPLMLPLPLVPLPLLLGLVLEPLPLLLPLPPRSHAARPVANAVVKRTAVQIFCLLMVILHSAMCCR